MKILVVCGTRPNFIKVAALMREFARHPALEARLVHTGQHYDARMSHLFFEQLELPRPVVNLGVGSGSQAVQTAEIMMRFEEVCLRDRPSHVLVVGDVNSTLACAIVAAKLGIKVIHVEAGLRSFDRSMPEEINRVLTDAISDLLFVSEESGVANLQREGVDADKVHFVGNVMIDTLLQHQRKAMAGSTLVDLGLAASSTAAAAPYVVVTLHRPANVDRPEVLAEILKSIGTAAAGRTVIFPVHPRTRQRIREFGLDRVLAWTDIAPGQPCVPGRFNAMDPFGYLEFLQLLSQAVLVVTDSGGIQEETTVLGVPCITVRPNTERPATVTHGTNRLVGTEAAGIVQGCREALAAPRARRSVPPLWDGHAAERIAAVLLRIATGNVA